MCLVLFPEHGKDNSENGFVSYISSLYIYHSFKGEKILSLPFIHTFRELIEGFIANIKKCSNELLMHKVWFLPVKLFDCHKS